MELSGIAIIGIGIELPLSELELELGTGFGIGVELPLSELELELNCKNGIDPSSVSYCTCNGTILMHKTMLIIITNCNSIVLYNGNYVIIQGVIRNYDRLCLFVTHSVQ